MHRNLQYEGTTVESVGFAYVKYMPENYDASKKYPLMIFLHGAGERGNDLSLIYRHGFFKHIKEQQAQYPYIIIAPQCPDGKYWGCFTESLNVFLDHIIAENNVDTDRIYLCGLSMGGTGTWSWAMANPERFAAIAPICGTGIYWNCGQLVHKPIWAFHGVDDTVVPVQESINMVRHLRELGGNPKLTLYDGVGHDAWSPAFCEPNFAEWFLQFGQK